MSQSASTWTEVTKLPVLPPRDPEGHKGDYGRVLVIGGSRGMAGAAGLAGMAALRGGAGLVTVACPEGVAPIVAGFEPSFMTLPVPEDAQGRMAVEAFDRLYGRRADVVALGPGLGQGAALTGLVHGLLAELEMPVVLDADGLNLLATDIQHLERRKAPTVLTPHFGEFARLTHSTTEEIRRDPRSMAVDFARRFHVVLVLKGHRSLITDGERLAVNQTGNAGMATGGAGDVLTGLVAGLLAQGLSPFEAAQLAVHVHGLAGDAAARRLSLTSTIARDILDAAPEAFLALERQRDSDAS